MLGLSEDVVMNYKHLLLAAVVCAAPMSSHAGGNHVTPINFPYRWSGAPQQYSSCPYGSDESALYDEVWTSPAMDGWTYNFAGQANCQSCVTNQTNIYAQNGQAGCSPYGSQGWVVFSTRWDNCAGMYEAPANAPRVAIVLQICHMYQCQCEADGPGGQLLQEP